MYIESIILFIFSTTVRTLSSICQYIFILLTRFLNKLANFGIDHQSVTCSHKYIKLQTYKAHTHKSVTKRSTSCFFQIILSRIKIQVIIIIIIFEPMRITKIFFHCFCEIQDPFHLNYAESKNTRIKTICSL